MWCQSGFVGIFICNFHLAVVAFSVHCSEFRGITKGLDTFVFTCSWIRARVGYRITFVIVHAESKWPFFLGWKPDCWCPFCLSWFDYIHHQQVVNFVLLKFSSWGRIGICEWISCLSRETTPVWCFSYLIWSKSPSHICCSFSSNADHLVRYAIYSSDAYTSLRQSISPM